MDIKQVIVINTSLGMSPGKMAAQACHAAVGAVERTSAKVIAQWHEFGTAKVVLQGNDEAHLCKLAMRAKERGLPVYLVADAGRTEIKAGSITALAIGPALAGKVDSITGNLKLY